MLQTRKAKITRPRSRGSSARQTLVELLGNYQLPSFPEAITDVLQALRDPDSAITEITPKLEADPGIHVRILRIVNSAAFGLARPVNSAKHAAMLLGRARLEAIVASVAVKQALPKSSVPGFDASHFWLTQARRASLARSLARLVHPAATAESFTAGLLQDLAVPILVNCFKDRYVSVYRQHIAVLDSDLPTLERQQFGFDHAAMGALVARQWGLPAFLVDTISNHHASEEHARKSPAVHLVANLRDSSENDGRERVVEACCATYGFSETQIEKVIEEAFADAEAFYRSMS